MAIASEEIRLVIKAEVDKAVADLKKFNTSLATTQQKSMGVADAFNKLRNMAGIYVAYEGLKKVVKAASDLEEATNKFQVVFKGNMEVANAGIKELTTNYAMSTREAMEYSATLGNMATSLGVSSEKATEMSMNLTKLASDYASFHNVSIAESLTAFRAALSGEAEPMKRFGKDLSENALKAQAFADGITKSTGPLTAQQKVLAAYSILMNKSNNEMGDMIRTGDSWSNVQRKILARLEDTAATIGAALLPGFRDLAKAILESSGSTNFFADGLKEVASFLGLVASATANTIRWLDNLNAKTSIISKVGDALKASPMYLMYKYNKAVLGAVAGDSAKADAGGGSGTGDEAAAALPSSVARPTGGGALKQQKKAHEEYLSYLSEFNEQAIAKETERYDAALTYAQEHKLSLEELEMQHQENLEAIRQQAYSKEIDNFMGKANAIAQFATQSLSQLSGISTAYANNEVARENKSYKKKQLLIKYLVKDKEDQDKALEVLALRQEFVQNQIQRREFERQKGLQIASATISMLTGAVQAFQSMLVIPVVGVILGAVAAAAVLAFGAANIAMIAQTQAPAMAEGGLIQGSQQGTMIRAGEGGMSEMILPLENPEVQDKMSGLGGTTNIFNFDGAIFASDNVPEEIITAIDRGLYKLHRGRQSMFAGALS